jgi:Uma2 family endonuclease
VVTKLGDLSSKLKRLGCYMRTQQPIASPPYHEPEPDGVIALGTADDYLDHKPAPDEILCVIEVADSSLEYDRTTKQRVYADSGLRLYVIVNLPDHVIEVYSQPHAGKGRYGKVETLSPRQTVRFPGAGGKELPVPVRRLLP